MLLLSNRYKLAYSIVYLTSQQNNPRRFFTLCICLSMLLQTMRWSLFIFNWLHLGRWNISGVFGFNNWFYKLKNLNLMNSSRFVNRGVCLSPNLDFKHSSALNLVCVFRVCFTASSSVIIILSCMYLPYICIQFLKIGYL